MPKVTGGYLTFDDAPAVPGRPTHPIAPGGGPPEWGVEGPVDPGFGVGLPPVASHPIAPSPGQPMVPPTYPIDPGYGLPVPPTAWPQPPKPVDPGYGVPLPVTPSHPIYLPAPGSPDNALPLPPGAVWPPLPPSVTGQILCFIWIVGVGYRWTVIDTGLKPSHPIAGGTPGGEHPSHPIAPGGGERPSHPIAPGGGERPSNKPVDPVEPKPV